MFVSRNLHLSYLGASLPLTVAGFIRCLPVYPSIIGAPGMSEGLAEVWQHSQVRLQLRKVSQMLGLHWKSQEFGIRSQIFLVLYLKWRGFLTDWAVFEVFFFFFFFLGGWVPKFRYLKCLVVKCLVKMWWNVCMAPWQMLMYVLS